MKSVTTICPFRLLVFAVMLLFAVTSNAATSSIGSPPTVQHAVQTTPAQVKQAKVNKRVSSSAFGWLGQINRAIKRRATNEGEEISGLALSAFFLFVGAIGFAVLATAIGSAIGLLLSLAALAVLASIVVALVVLSGDENKKSKKLAKTLLIVISALILVALLLFAAFLSAF